MRGKFKFLIIVTVCSCGQTSEQTETKQDNITGGNVNITDTLKANEKAGNDPSKWTVLNGKQQEDSIRNVILQKKENRVLKESFLQEMYIRNVVNVLRGNLIVNIPFNLHGPDCGAPDGYSTDISFRFKFDDTLIFPKSIQFQEHEHGCIDKEIKLSGRFQLVEETIKHVIYHSIEHKRTLVLFSSNKENGTTAYYFTGVDKKRINGKNVYNIMQDYNDEDKNSIYPFTSWVLTTNEYENFVY